MSLLRRPADFHLRSDPVLSFVRTGLSLDFTPQAEIISGCR